MKQWKSIVSKLVLVIFAGVLFFSGQTNTYAAAAVGNKLTAPEAGWNRYDDSHPSLKWNGSVIESSGTTNYNNSLHYWTNTTGASLEFKFSGNKLRILGAKTPNESAQVKVTIDGVSEIYSAYNVTDLRQIMVYEKLNLSNTEHDVKIESVATGYWGIDAIDIDATGYLINTNLSAPVELSAAAAIEKIDLSWTAVTNATSYNVKRSLTTGGPYETIASNVTNATYTDLNVTSDVEYYYVVTAVNAAGESISSNEVSAIPLAAEVPDTGRAILTIYLTNGAEKEYDLSMNEVNAFIDWYDQKDAGVSTAKYAFIKTWNKGSFIKRTEYVIFDKILTFNVDEYVAEK